MTKRGSAPKDMGSPNAFGKRDRAVELVRSHCCPLVSGPGTLEHQGACHGHSQLDLYPFAEAGGVCPAAAFFSLWVNMEPPTLHVLEDIVDGTLPLSLRHRDRNSSLSHPSTPPFKNQGQGSLMPSSEPCSFSITATWSGQVATKICLHVQLITPTLVHVCE